MTDIGCGEPAGIPHEHHVWRTASANDLIDEGDGKRVANFDFTPDVSVFWKEHVTAHGMSDADIVGLEPKRNFVFEALALDIRTLVTSGNPTFVVYTPFPGEPPRCAHSSVLVMGLKAKNVSGKEKNEQEARRKLARDNLRDVFQLVAEHPSRLEPESSDPQTSPES